MIIDTYRKTKQYEEENRRKVIDVYSDDIEFFELLYDQNLEIAKWLSDNKKLPSAREALVVTRLHRALRILFTCHNLVLVGQCDEARVLLRNVVELLLSAVDIRVHGRAWGEVQAGRYSFQSCSERVRNNSDLQRYHRWVPEHGKLSGLWSHENLRTDRIDSHPTTHADGEPAVRQELNTGYAFDNPRLWLALADVIKLTREITQTIDFLLEQVLQKERAEEWQTTKQQFECFLEKEERFAKKWGIRNHPPSGR